MDNPHQPFPPVCVSVSSTFFLFSSLCFGLGGAAITSAFDTLRQQGQYPILSKAKIEESWPNIQCHFHDLPGMLKEVFSNDGLVVRIANRMEGFSMYFACGVADGDKAYRPAASIFCEASRAFLPYLIFANERENQFTYTLALYGTWAIRRFSEDTSKEIAQKSDMMSKIRVPEVHPIGTKEHNMSAHSNP